MHVSLILLSSAFPRGSLSAPPRSVPLGVGIPARVYTKGALGALAAAHQGSW